MPSIRLSWDAGKKFFSLPVHLQRNTSGFSEPPQYVSAETLMYIDTGSGISSITDREALQLGVEISSLPKKPIGGIGGLSDMPIVM